MSRHRVLFVYYGTRGLAGAYLDGFARALAPHGGVEPCFAVSAAYPFPPRRGQIWRIFFPITDRCWRGDGTLRLAVRYAELCLAYTWLAATCVLRRIHTVNLSLIDDYFVTWAFLATLKLLGRRVHVTAHDTVSFADRRDVWRRRTFDAADKVLVHHEHARRDLEQGFGVGRDRVIVLPFPWADAARDVPPDRVERATADVAALVERTRQVVLFAGVLRPEKGVHVLIEAWRALASPEDAVLVVAGRGPSLQAELEGLAAIRVPEYLSDEHYVAWLRRASLVVFPYVARHYAHSSTVLLAALEGRPVVLSDIPLFEPLAGPLQAWVASAGDAVSLTDALSGALGADPAHLTARGALARQAVLSALDDLPDSLGAGYARALLAQAQEPR
jgi:glycosyltransferase involved in cell wall biosynthesis